MQQIINIIRADENGASTPYIVHERISQFASPNLPNGFKLIREQRGQDIFFLVCAPIKDVEWSDIPTESVTEGYSTQTTGGNADTKL